MAAINISYSSLEVFQSCRQKARYLLDGWRLGYKKDSLLFGSMIHIALHSIREKGTEVQDAVYAAVDKLRSKFSDEQTLEIMSVKAECLLKGYAKYYKSNRFRYEVTEKRFEVEWKEFKLVGYCDSLAVAKDHTRWIFETKTRSRFPTDQSMSEQLLFNMQSLFYFFTNKLLMGKPLKGVIYDIIRNPGMKYTGDPVGFGDKLSADIDKRPEHYFKRFQIMFPDFILKRFEKELEAKCQEYTDWREGRMATYRNESACTGRYNCEFIAACASGEMYGYVKEKKRKPAHASKKTRAKAIKKNKKSPAKKKARKRKKVTKTRA